MTAEQSDDQAAETVVSPGDLSGLEAAAPAEAAAVAAAIGAHIRDQELSVGAVDGTRDDADWVGERWRFADRLSRSNGRVGRIPETLPRDPWTAAGRTDRL